MKKYFLLSFLSIILATLPTYSYAVPKINPDKVPTCAELGYTDRETQCPQSFISCPFDKTQVFCIPEAELGEIQYFFNNPGPGWLLCDGKSLVNRYEYPIVKTPNMIDKYVKISSTAGKEEDDGLPGIGGSFYIGPSIGNGISDANINSYMSGAFVFEKLSNSSFPIYSSPAMIDATNTINFDANRSNSIYQNGKAVNPINVKIMPFIYVGKSL